MKGAVKLKESLTEPKDIFFAHSAGAQEGPGEGSFDLVSCLRKELSDLYEIHFPLIEDPEAPTYAMWKELFSTELEILNQPLILIGHSLGGSMLLKYLLEERHDIKVSALLLVASPYWGKNGWDVEEFALNENIEMKLKDIEKIYLYHSKEDDTVPFEHSIIYNNMLPNSTIRAIDGTDHVFADGLSELVDDIKSIDQRR